MNRKWFYFLAALYLLSFAVPAEAAGPLSVGLGVWKDSLGKAVKTVAEPLGMVCTVLGGGRAAWAAAHGEKFTTPLLAAIVGLAMLTGAFSWL
jgi:hypothetical protein